MTPDLVLYLANLHRPRRAGHTGTPAALADTLMSLSAHDGGNIRTDQLDQLARVASGLTDALIAGRLPLPVAELNALARPATNFVRLIAEPATAVVRLERIELSTEPVALLAGRLVGELAAADLTRIKECARSECTLVFYDPTRSRTQRWHAETPCGQLERQRRHRTR